MTRDEAESVTACTVCRSPLADGLTTYQYAGGDVRAVLCGGCDTDRRWNEYADTGEVTMRLVMDAQMHDAGSRRLGGDWKWRRRATEVMAAWRAVEAAFGAAEMAVWFDRPDVEPWMEHLWTPGPNAVQTFYRTSPTRCHSATAGTFRALLWGCAGRVMLTLDGGEAHGGARITLIFDESSRSPTGGIQDAAGTIDQLVGLLDALRQAHPLNFQQDDEVTVA